MTTDFDLPLFATPDQIRRREFVATRRGYDPDQVRAYLEQLADQIAQLEAGVEAVVGTPGRLLDLACPRPTTWSAVRRTTSYVVSRPRELAVMSRNTSSSAPCSS